MAQVEALNLTKIYTVGDEEIVAVNNVSLSIQKGDFISIVGHSGSGKTTLLSMIGGILRPTSGRVLFEGVDICSLDDDSLSDLRNQKFGFIFQAATLLPTLTAKENVLLPVAFGGWRNTVDTRVEERAVELLKLIGLEEKIDAYPSQLSGGQQRRVAIARALINEPQLILADEPTGDLDEETEAEIIALFHKINRQWGTTFIIVTHSLDIARQCKKVYRMKQGTLKEEITEYTA